PGTSGSLGGTPGFGATSALTGGNGLGAGGAVFVGGGNVTFNNCTFAGNLASGGDPLSPNINGNALFSGPAVTFEVGAGVTTTLGQSIGGDGGYAGGITTTASHGGLVKTGPGTL